MIEPVREFSLPYPCDSIKKFGREKHRMQESGGQGPRPEGRPHSATPELLQLLAPGLGGFESVEVLPSKR
jgi:hypothetical protein